MEFIKRPAENIPMPYDDQECIVIFHNRIRFHAVSACYCAKTNSFSGEMFNREFEIEDWLYWMPMPTELFEEK